MYKKLARIGPISCGIFYALMSLLMLIVMTLIGMFILPLIPMPEGAPPVDIFQTLPLLIQSEGGLMALGAVIAGTLISGFIVGLISAILYNIVAMITGGIKVKTHDLGYDDI